MPHPHRRWLIKAASGLAAGLSVPSYALAERREEAIVAPTPPMGWSAGRSFVGGITEVQALEIAQLMVDKLLAAGYDLLVLDAAWAENLDGYGRPVPAPARFPSSADGAGFGPFADRLRDSFLRFGLSLKRGIPKRAVDNNLLIMGTNLHVRDIANLQKLSGDMYSVDTKKGGAQAYYNSVFKQFAEWGVDFVRIEDTSRSYADNYTEIEAIKTAVEASGRPMVLSLATGVTELKWAEWAEQHAQMWRISEDMSGDWKSITPQFKRLKDWTPYRGPGRWPEAGDLSFGSTLSRDEKTSLMTLWAITRSPLLISGDLHGLDAAAFELMTNPEVLAVNQKSLNNRASYMKNEGDAYHYWTAKPEDGKGLYVALFNLSDQERFRYINLWEVGLDGKKSVRDLWARTELGPVKQRFGLTLPPHGAGLFLID